MACSTRRCTGLRPSRASGRARPITTDIAYDRYADVASSDSSASTMRPPEGDATEGTAPNESSDPLEGSSEPLEPAPAPDDTERRPTSGCSRATVPDGNANAARTENSGNACKAGCATEEKKKKMRKKDEQLQLETTQTTHIQGSMHATSDGAGGPRWPGGMQHRNQASSSQRTKRTRTHNKEPGTTRRGTRNRSMLLGMRAKRSQAAILHEGARH